MSGQHALLRCLLAPEVHGGVELDWASLAVDVRLLCAEPLLYSSLRRAHRLGELPAALRVELQRSHATTTAHNLELAHDVRELAAALAAARVPWVPLKGAALLTLDVYRDFGARPTSDIDVVTRRSDRQHVESTLWALGYTQLSHGSSKHLPPFARGNMLVEVHESAFWRIQDGAPTGLDEMRDVSGRPRLEQTVAHLVHHALESSVPTPSLLVKTLCDVNEVRLRAAGDAGLAERVAAAARRAGLEEQLAAFAGATALIIEQDPTPGWAGANWRERGDWLLRQCLPLERRDADALRVAARARGMLRQPWKITAGFLRTRLLPPRGALEEAYGLPDGSRSILGAYVLHLGGLALRSAGDLVRLARLKFRGPVNPNPSPSNQAARRTGPQRG